MTVVVCDRVSLRELVVKDGRATVTYSFKVIGKFTDRSYLSDKSKSHDLWDSGGVRSATVMYVLNRVGGSWKLATGSYSEPARISSASRWISVARRASKNRWSSEASRMHFKSILNDLDNGVKQNCGKGK